jgi:cell division protein FtsB
MKKGSLYLFVTVLLFSLFFANFTSNDTLAATSKVTVEQLQKTIVSLKKEITNLKSTITKKDSEIKSLKTSSTKKDNEIKTLKNTIIDKNKEIDTLNSSLEAKRKEILAKDNEIKTLKERLSKYDGGATTSGNSRQNPAKLGETITVEEDDWQGHRKYSVTLTDVKSGVEAWNLIKNANMFNSPPKAGMKYILVKFKVKALDIENEPFEINNAMFDAVSSSGVKYDNFVSLVAPDPKIRTDLYNGAEHEGWTYFEVKTEDNPLIVMNQKYPDEIWFRLDK